jgi:hypothetical protein
MRLDSSFFCQFSTPTFIGAHTRGRIDFYQRLRQLDPGDYYGVVGSGSGAADGVNRLS